MDTTIFDLDPSQSWDVELMTALGDLDEQFLNDLNLYDPYCIEDNIPHQKSGLLEEMEAFQRIPVSEWHGEHCVDWAVAVCRSRGLQELAVDVSSFGHISGYELLTYSVNDFANRLGEPYGIVFFKELQKMDKGGIIYNGFEDVVDLSRTGPHASSQIQQEYYYYPQSPEQALNLSINNTMPTNYHTEYSQDYKSESPSAEYQASGYYSDNQSSGYLSDYQMEYHSDSEDYCILENMAQPPVEMSGGVSENLSQSYRVIDVVSISPPPPHTPVAMPQEMYYMEEDIPQTTGPHEVPYASHAQDVTKSRAKASRNEHVTIENSELVNKFCKKISTTSRARERGPKNWEFLIHLLMDSQTNPKLIRWEDESKLTFRLVRPEIITSLWNAKNPSKKLSYDNFARGLRYHYKTGALFKVGDRQLVYGCGPKAIELINHIKRNQY